MNHKLIGPPAQQGFTLIEILIALLIGLFLMGALLTIVQSNRRVYGEQNQLAQMQDNQRVAMTMMADVIQSAGYFPRPDLNTLTTALGASGSFGIGQSITGTYAAAAPWDQIQVRYMTAGGDGILNCSGQSNPAGGPNTVYVNSFRVDNGQLKCTLTPSGTEYVLVGGLPGSGLDVTKMVIMYGVKTDATSFGNNVDAYMRADQLTPALWGNIISVKVKLTFTNPLNISGTVPGQLPTYDVERVISVMSQTGPTL